MQHTVTLLSHTPDALALLLRTKNTRLAHDDEPANWSIEKQLEHLAYMRDTIKSSWEFVDYTFELRNVSRVFTHQLVRTRNGSYAQESQRTIDASGRATYIPDGLSEAATEEFESFSAHAMDVYTWLQKIGVQNQDARGILPNNILTSIIAKFSLRTLHEMAKVRLCVRTQGEYQDVFRSMRDQVIAIHPWAEDFIQVHCVSEGTCAFPRYGKKECPFYDPRMDLDALKQETAVKFWDGTRHVANPIAKNGRTM
jgi:flavin-dependent thymidylate synthase